jgi:hypothetical protein
MSRFKNVPAPSNDENMASSCTERATELMIYSFINKNKRYADRKIFQNINVTQFGEAILFRLPE